MTLYFDGACPLCAAEIHFLSARNRRNLLRFVDLSQSGGELPCAVVCSQAMARIHATFSDGRTLVGVPVFAEAYRRVDLSVLAWLLSQPWLAGALGIGYTWFARHRGRISALVGPSLLRLVRWCYR